MHRQDNFVGSPAHPDVVRCVENLKDEIREGAEACIHAAIRSTTAFDGVPPRLIVTNIFGTAHA